MEALWQLFFDIIGDTLQYRSSGAPFIGGVKVDVFLTSQLFAETEHLGQYPQFYDEACVTENIFFAWPMLPRHPTSASNSTSNSTSTQPTSV